MTHRQRVLRRIDGAMRTVANHRAASHIGNRTQKDCPACQFNIALRYLVRKAKEGT